VRPLELDRHVGETLPDLAGPGLRLLIVGINPGLHTAAVQAHFARPGNRFYPALYRAGILDRVVDASAGLDPGDREHILARGVGLTSLVRHATRRADELSTADLVAGAVELEERVRALRPRVVALLGVTAYRTATGRRSAAVGLQPERLGGAELWVVPNPSGLNAHETVDSLAAAYRAPAAAAGIELYDVPGTPGGL
jgi:TDG/mug DNA glycosylase family protein